MIANMYFLKSEDSKILVTCINGRLMPMTVEKSGMVRNWNRLTLAKSGCILEVGMSEVAAVAMIEVAIGEKAEAQGTIII